MKLEVKLDRGAWKMPVEKAIKILKKKLLKERVLRELRDRQYYVSRGRKRYLEKCHREHIQSFSK